MNQLSYITEFNVKYHTGSAITASLYGFMSLTEDVCSQVFFPSPGYFFFVMRSIHFVHKEALLNRFSNAVFSPVKIALNGSSARGSRKVMREREGNKNI